MYRVFIVGAFVVFYMATVCSADTSVKIINGSNANIEDHPWMVHIQIRRNESANFTTFCGGAIIDKSWVLTAAHCNLINSGGPAKNMRVAAGSSFLSQMKVKIPVKKYYELQKPLKFGSTINKIDIDTEIGKNYTGDMCTITGWGDTDINLGGNYPDRLQVLSMPVVSNEYCGIKHFISKTYLNNILCLQDKEKKDSCEKDSGGPVVCSKKLVGALSYGVNGPCDGFLPSVYTRISAYLDWIKDKMNMKNKKKKEKKKDKKKKSNTNRKGKKNKKINRN